MTTCAAVFSHCNVGWVDKIADFLHMITPAAATIYPCYEYGIVELPIEEVVSNGATDIFPEVTSRGYFDIDFRAGRLVLAAKSFVGLIPINKRVSIHVLPRFPIANLLYFVHKADAALRTLVEHSRSYRLAPLVDQSPEALFGETLLTCLLDIEKSGLLHRYIPRTTTGEWRGRLLVSPTISRFAARGIKHKQVREITDRTVDIAENQLIKDTVRKLAFYYSRRRDAASQRLARTSAQLSQLFDRVTGFDGDAAALARDMPRRINRLEGGHASYAQVLWLCYLVATKRGVVLEEMGSTPLATMLVDLSEVFENYVREVLREQLETIVPAGILRNGNQQQVALFCESNDTPLKPDIYVRQGNRCVLVLDAKYKFTIKAADRYEILAFCEGLQSKCAIFLSPMADNSAPVTFCGRTPSGVEMYELRIAMDALDMRSEEQRFINELRRIAAPHTATNTDPKTQSVN